MERPQFKEKPLAGDTGMVIHPLAQNPSAWPAGTQVVVIWDPHLDTGDVGMKEQWVPVMRDEDMKGFDPYPKDPVGRAVLMDKFNKTGDYARWVASYPYGDEFVLPAEIVPIPS